MKLQFEPMQNHDVDAIIKIESEATQYPWSARNYHDALDANNIALIAKTQKNTWVGHVVLLPVADEAQLLNLVISRPLQNKGYAKTILNHAITLTAKQGIKQMFLEVRENNAPAIRLYKHMGFIQTGLRQSYYRSCSAQERENALVMRLDYCSYPQSDFLGLLSAGK